MAQLVKSSVTGLALLGLLTVAAPLVQAEDATKPAKGSISGRSAVAGALSLIVWPGIGQAVNDNKGQKVATHAVLGLLPPYRFWSAYDALVDRRGGYWKGRI